MLGVRHIKLALGVHAESTLVIEPIDPVYHQVGQVNAALFVHAMPTLVIELVGALYYQVFQVHVNKGMRACSSQLLLLRQFSM